MQDSSAREIPTELRVLFVCLGNICRSPMAEGILRDRVQRLGLHWEVDSAGTSDLRIGQPPDPRAIEEAARHGIDISGKISRLFEPVDFDRFDLIIALDRSVEQTLREMAGDEPMYQDKIHLLTEYSTQYRNQDVPDPFVQGGFDVVYEMLDESIDGLIEAFEPHFIADA